MDWQRVSTDSRRCVGSRCRFINKCPYYQEKEEQEEADVLVANHDLVLSDLKLGGGVILPSLEDVILIFDEAHALPEKAREHFAVRAPVKGTQTMLKQTRELMGRIEKQLKKEKKAVEKAQHVATNSVSLEARMGEAFTAITSLVSVQPELVHTNWEGKKTLRFPHGKVPESMQDMGETISEEAMSCCKKMAQIKGDVVKAAEKGDINHTEAEPMVSELGDLAGRMENLALLWKGYAQADPEKGIPRARWINFVKHKSSTDYLVEVSSISLAQTLKNCLWDEIYGAVLTSATITELGEFHRYFEKTGLNLVGGVQTAKLQSPFDFPNRGTLWIPQLQSLPNAEDHHVEEVSDILPQIVKEGEGTLILFSSKRKLGKVIERLPDDLLDRALIQGDMPKQRILREHKKRIEKGEGSVIFGLASFGEGVDLPGKLCSHVIIEKLPFAVPDSPIEATLSEYLESMGRNPFMEIAVPAVSIKLVQMMGRLIRTEDDYGLITLLDRRVLVKRYGQLLLNSLPEYRRQFDGITHAA
jgi:ATP-dependent DNA helicase DinG